MKRNWWSLVCALMLHARARRLGPFSWRYCPRRARSRSASAAAACKQKYAAWKSQKEPGKGLEVGSVVPKWVPGDDYCTLLERCRPRGRYDDLFVQTVKCRGSCERGPNAIALDDDTEEEIELEDMCLETGRITLFGLRSRARMDDVVAKAAAYCDARRRRTLCLRGGALLSRKTRTRGPFLERPTSA